MPQINTNYSFHKIYHTLCLKTVKLNWHLTTSGNTVLYDFFGQWKWFFMNLGRDFLAAKYNLLIKHFMTAEIEIKIRQINV